MAERKYSLRAYVILGLLSWLALAAAPLLGGEYHIGDHGKICSDCHVMHASKSTQTWTPSPYLLKNTSEVPLCMSCHDGTDPGAPDIVSSGSSSAPSSVVTTAYTSKYGSSAGFYQGDYLTQQSSFGHDLTGPVTAPLSNTFSRPNGLSCSDCHATHGSLNYRNLVSDPNPAHPGSFPIVLGTNVAEAVLVNPTAYNPAEAYDTNNVSFFVANNFRGWCTDCHDMLAQDAQGVAPAHFAGHPSDIAIGGAYGHTAFDNWSSGTVSETSGFGVDTGDSAAGIPRLRFGSTSGSNTAASTGDTVFCLSCHKAHGSAHRAALVWPHRTDSPDSISGCQQCHYK